MTGVVDVNFDQSDFAKKSGIRTYFVYYVDKSLSIVPLEAIDRIAPIFTRENRLNQGGKFVQGEGTSDQTFTGWNIKVEKGGESRSDQFSSQDQKRWVVDVPLSGREIVASSSS